MLAHVVLVLQALRSRLHFRIDEFRLRCHFCAYFYDDCVVNCFLRILSPAEWAVVRAEASRNFKHLAVHAAEFIHDQ